jgi:glutathione-independent formaldehyde dehydrogenase
MPSNRGVVYLGPGKVNIQNIDFPTLRNPAGKKIEHGVILKVVATNICGSDQHMVRGRTTAPAGMVLGHEITGEIIEIGRDVEYLSIGDLVSVPFNVACGRCRTCREGNTGVCLNVNPERAGGAYGYVDMGGWIGGQAEYVMVPYADFNCLKFPDKAQALEKIRDLTQVQSPCANTIENRFRVNNIRDMERTLEQMARSLVESGAYRITSISLPPPMTLFAG